MQRHQIYVQGSDVPFPCREDESILDAMRRAGRGPIHHGCCGGGCGVCKMIVMKGEVDPFKPMSRAHVSAEEAREGVALICCIRPLTEVHLALTAQD